METINTTPHEYILVNSKTKRKALIRKLKLQPSICFDSETGGESKEQALDVHELEIVGISFSYKEGTAYYIPLPDGYKEAQTILKEFECVFADKQKEIIGHNLKFDLKVLKKYNIAFTARIFDTMLADFLLRPDNKKHDMDSLAEELLNYSPIPIEDLIGPAKTGNKKVKQKSMRDVPVEVVCEYAAEDADVTFQLKQILEEELIAEDLIDLFNDVECRLIPVLVDMEYKGVRIDEKRFAKLAVNYKAKKEAVEKKIYNEVGRKFKISSPKQLGEILFDDPTFYREPEYTKTGAYSTSAPVLKKLQKEDPLIKQVLAYRNFKSLQQRATKLPTLINKRTKRLHTNFNQAIAATGRLSSSTPNLQSLPSRDKEGKLIRKAIIPSEENIFVLADYSQVELCIMAHLSQDEELITSFENREDIHAKTAAKLFNVPVADVTDEQRGIAKTVNFGINYGMGAESLANKINIETGTNYSEYDAEDWIDSFFEQYSGVKQYILDQVDFAYDHGYTKTMMGRKRYFPEIAYGIGKRNAINFSIQGTAADILKVAMINIHVRLIKENLKAQMVLTVHDEIVVDTPITEKTIVENLVKEEMETAIELCIPLKAEVQSGIDWLDAKKKKKPEIKTVSAAA